MSMTASKGHGFLYVEHITDLFLLRLYVSSWVLHTSETTRRSSRRWRDTGR